jgi:hypothetical protein
MLDRTYVYLHVLPYSSIKTKNILFIKYLLEIVIVATEAATRRGLDMRSRLAAALSCAMIRGSTTADQVALFTSGETHLGLNRLRSNNKQRHRSLREL